MGHRSQRHFENEPSPERTQHDAGSTDPRGFASEHRRGLLPEPYFRWRGREITRLEAFCDVVFGFALTLLVVSLEVPRNYAELMAVMRGFVPFAICFAQLIMLWRAHYQFSRRYGLEDPYTVLLNIVLLFVVLFYVYPLKYVFSMVFAQVTGNEAVTGVGWHEASVLMRVYAAGFAAVFLLLGLMYLHAYKLRHALGLDEVEVLETRVSLQQNAIMVITGTVSFLLAVRSPALAGWWYFVLGPALGIHGAVSGRRVRLLAERTRPS
jgi:uncharacterized membrane protein